MNDKFGWTGNEYISVKNFNDKNTFFANTVARRLNMRFDDISDFQQEVIEKINDKEFQDAARQRYKILAGIEIEKKPEGYLMSRRQSAAYFRRLCEETPFSGLEEEADSSELPTQRAGKTIKELTQEVQFDLERESDVKKREELIMRCARYMRLERMSKSLKELK